MTIAAEDPIRRLAGFEAFRRALKPRIIDLTTLPSPPDPGPRITVMSVPAREAPSHAAGNGLRLRRESEEA